MAVTEKNDLLLHLEKLHTTPLGVQRLQRNLSLCTWDVVDWCKEKIRDPQAVITRQGKNWYISIDGCQLTVNAHSYTIITASVTLDPLTYSEKVISESLFASAASVTLDPMPPA